MDPVTAIANTIGSAFDFFRADKQAKYDRLPDWMSPRDFQTKDHTSNIILIGMFLVLLAVIIAIIFSARRGVK